MTSRSGRSRYSATSGVSQLALNAIRSTQDMLARMESKQDTTQAQLNQRIDQAFPGDPDAGSSAWGRQECLSDLQKSLDDQWESGMSTQMQRLQEEITSLKEVRNQDQEAIRSPKNVRGTSSRNIRATSTEVQGIRSTVYSQSSNAIKDDAVHSQDASGDSALAAQLQQTLPSVTEVNSSVESSEEGDSSSDSDSSSDGMPSYATMVTNLKEAYMLTLRTFTNALDDFDEKKSLWHVADGGRSS
ncbi:hypothetical protein PHMEG_0008481 [Phytophthora megakarya]|uniref:Uncharacterized protein n=1 Tax=Phytophthora megakarya TaxID=4795 RepID=A0A225WIX8_9STRA|nr:hypothetical protein PHMEG_0008481 [Phytophthora megakarya]